MATPNETYKSYAYQPFYYANGLNLSNDATTPNSIINVATGSIQDSTATYQIQVTTALTASLLVSGIGGLDTGTIAASSVYAVYVIADPVTLQAPALVFSLSLTQPLMPFGYSAFAVVGYVATDASSHILKGYWSSRNSTTRLFMFDAPQATSITAGAATTYTNVNLIKFVPALNNLPVYINTSFTPGAASRVLDLQPGNATGDSIIVTGQVTSVVVTTQSMVLAQNVVISTVSSPVVNYKVSNAGDAVAINVAGYQYFVG